MFEWALGKGCFKKLENIQEIYDKLLYLAAKYPDYSLDKILNNPSERYDLRNQIRKPLRNFFYKKTKRTPMILPIIFKV